MRYERLYSYLSGTCFDMIKAKLNKPIQFAFSYDEEVGCVGAIYD